MSSQAPKLELLSEQQQQPTTEQQQQLQFKDATTQAESTTAGDDKSHYTAEPTTEPASKPTAELTPEKKKKSNPLKKMLRVVKTLFTCLRKPAVKETEGQTKKDAAVEDAKEEEVNNQAAAMAEGDEKDATAEAQPEKKEVKLQGTVTTITAGAGN
ncbi:hypothetical protein N0V88_001512 [Collariella sp. IMI 366227]|nr:hypothetical protein N0V88_001512 [Collariella sp. IMI 366227]